MTRGPGSGVAAVFVVLLFAHSTSLHAREPVWWRIDTELEVQHASGSDVDLDVRALLLAEEILGYRFVGGSLAFRWLNDLDGASVPGLVFRDLSDALSEPGESAGQSVFVLDGLSLRAGLPEGPAFEIGRLAWIGPWNLVFDGIRAKSGPPLFHTQLEVFAGQLPDRYELGGCGVLEAQNCWLGGGLAGVHWGGGGASFGLLTLDQDVATAWRVAHRQALGNTHSLGVRAAAELYGDEPVQMGFELEWQWSPGGGSGLSAELFADWRARARLPLALLESLLLNADNQLYLAQPLNALDIGGAIELTRPGWTARLNLGGMDVEPATPRGVGLLSSWGERSSWYMRFEHMWLWSSYRVLWAVSHRAVESEDSRSGAPIGMWSSEAAAEAEFLPGLWTRVGFWAGAERYDVGASQARLGQHGALLELRWEDEAFAGYRYRVTVRYGVSGPGLGRFSTIEVLHQASLRLSVGAWL